MALEPTLKACSLEKVRPWAQIAEEIASRINAALPAGIRIDIPEGTADFAVYADDYHYGTAGFGFGSGTRDDDVADQIEIALSSIQDTVIYATQAAWPDLEDGEPPEPWVVIEKRTVTAGFGCALELSPFPLD